MWTSCGRGELFIILWEERGEGRDVSVTRTEEKLHFSDTTVFNIFILLR